GQSRIQRCPQAGQPVLLGQQRGRLRHLLQAKRDQGRCRRQLQGLACARSLVGDRPRQRIEQGLVFGRQAQPTQCRQRRGNIGAPCRLAGWLREPRGQQGSRRFGIARRRVGGPAAARLVRDGRFDVGGGQFQAQRLRE